jgi:hypothetical protein
MTKKVAVIVGGGNANLAAAISKAFANMSNLQVTVSETDKPTAVLDEDTMTIGINVGFYDNLSDRELYGITKPDAFALINDRKLGDYRLHKTPAEVVKDLHIDFYEDLPDNTTKPKFLMARDHHIRSPRGRR